MLVAYAPRTVAEYESNEMLTTGAPRTATDAFGS